MTTTYEALHAATSRMEKSGITAMDSAMLHTMPALYRRLVAELAEARARRLPKAHIAAMEALVVRAHAMLYAPAPMAWGSAWKQLVWGFPQAVRDAWRPLLLAVCVTCVGGVWGFAEVRRAPENAAILLPDSLQKNAEESFQPDVHGPSSPLRGAFYFTHNATVALNAFSLGATFGVGTLIALLFNGIILGATVAVVQRLASLSALCAFILPHSGVELTAIFIAAAGGLRMAHAMLCPGWTSRRLALMQAAREALPLAMGAAALLAIAGLVEGWISPMPLPLWGKASIGAALDTALAVYLLATPNKVSKKADV